MSAAVIPTSRDERREQQPTPPSTSSSMSAAAAAMLSEESRYTPTATYTTTTTPPWNIFLEEGDLAEGNWGDASLVYAASVYFDDALMLDIARRCHGLGDRARVVTLDKPLPPPEVVPPARGGSGEFEVEWQCEVEGCWGGSAVAFVHGRRRAAAPVG